MRISRELIFGITSRQLTLNFSLLLTAYIDNECAPEKSLSMSFVTLWSSRNTTTTSMKRIKCECWWQMRKKGKSVCPLFQMIFLCRDYDIEASRL